MIKDIREINFPDYATLEQATVTINDMGDCSISTQVRIEGSIVPDFSYDWEVEFKGERYIHPVRKPQGTKDNASMSTKIDMVFYHWAIYEMKRHYFVEMASTTAGTSIADKYIASLGLNLGNFVTAFNLVLKHYFGSRIVVKLNPEWQYDAEAQFMSISYSYIWDVLQQMHDIYGVRWTLKTNDEGVCEILMGYSAEEVSHIFEYGFEGGLLSVQRQVQSTDIRNRLLGRGGEKNLPFRYFKDKDPKNPLFEADPDWIPELANIAFTELRGKTFRDYVKGWKAKHYDGAAMDEPTEAYLAGYNAEKFDPTEYVEDKESIAKYGVLIGALENNEEIYPSIQGAPGDVDKIVDAEQVVDDDVDSAVEQDSVVSNLKSTNQTYRGAEANSVVNIETSIKTYFSIPEGKVGNIDMSVTVDGKEYDRVGDYVQTFPTIDSVNVKIFDKNTGVEVKTSAVPVANIPAGDYYYVVSADVSTNSAVRSLITLNVESVYLYVSTPLVSAGWKPSFDIWVRNIWGSSRNSGETDEQYADRVWAPILGDRTGGEARVVFASGWLSFSSDWEFPIVGYAYDDSKEGSHWRLTLAKSEAELEASGKYIPYEGYNASAGDRFFFIGIDMPYQYVLWAEERLDNFKRDSLLKTSDINPTWVIKTDKVRLNQDREGAVLVDSLNAGSQIRLASKQFISGAYETLYVQSMTYTWSADTILHPDVEIVVSDKVYTVKNPVAQIQSSIETIQRQVGSLSNIQQIIRQVCDTLYLRKDGVSDISKSPTKFLGRVTGEKFREGQVGGRDWGIYRDESGKSIAEFDKIIVRDILSVAELEANHVSHIGSTRIMSKAEMECIAVEDTAEGYVCYFDQKQGSKVNLFAVNDIAWCQDFDGSTVSKYYKATVVSVGDNYITLSKKSSVGNGVPSVGDVIVQCGNTSDPERQAIIVMDASQNPSISLYRGVDSFDLPDPETRIQAGNNLFTGKVRMEAGSVIPEEVLGDLSESLGGLVEGLEFGKYNLLRNSGFTGDFVTESLDVNKVLNGESQMFSDPFDHWTVTNGSVASSSTSQSGYVCVLNNGSLKQEMVYNMIAGESYVLSFRGKGTKLTFSVGGVTKTIELTDTQERYVEKFVASNGSNVFEISDASAIICELQLERGNVVSAWGHSMWDNQSEIAKYQTLQYILSALSDGSTTVWGGLILSNLLMLGNPAKNDNTAGVSGIYNNDTDVAFWAGGDMNQAMTAAMMYHEDPNYQPTEQELASMAKAVITHGGRAILNDAVIRGMIYAKGGEFSGTIRANGGQIGNIMITVNPYTGEAVLNSRDVCHEGRHDYASFTSDGFFAESTFNEVENQCSLGNETQVTGMGFRSSRRVRNARLFEYEEDEGNDVADIIVEHNTEDGEFDGTETSFKSNSGMFEGLRPKTRVVSTARATLTEFDCSVVVSQTSGSCSVTLGKELDGQEYLIESMGATVVIEAGSRIFDHATGTTSSTYTMAGRGAVRLKFYHGLGWTAKSL